MKTEEKLQALTNEDFIQLYVEVIENPIHSNELVTSIASSNAHGIMGAIAIFSNEMVRRIKNNLIQFN